MIWIFLSVVLVLLVNSPGFRTVGKYVAYAGCFIALLALVIALTAHS